MTPHYEDDLVTVFHGDCLNVLHDLPDNSVDAIVTDRTYDVPRWERLGRIEFLRIRSARKALRAALGGA